MPRHQINEIYIQFIGTHALSDRSNREIHEEMERLFNRNTQDRVLEPIPSEATIQRYRKRLRPIKEAEVNDEFNSHPLQQPWEFRRSDPDGIEPTTCKWIIENIISNEKIMKHFGFAEGVYSDYLSPLTRRTAMWINALLNVLDSANSFKIWAIAWLYSNHEMICERKGEHFSTIAIDQYVSYQPWLCEENRLKYEKALRDGTVLNLETAGDYGTIYLWLVDESYPQPASNVVQGAKYG